MLAFYPDEEQGNTEKEFEISEAIMTQKRKAISKSVELAVLTEAGYRCAVPTCRNILAIDLHHMAEVSEGGPNDASNLLALCPTCHALFHRGTISRESIYSWKSLLVTLNQAFDKDAIDNLLFLANPKSRGLKVSGDGVLKFTKLITADLATFRQSRHGMDGLLCSIEITEKGKMLVEAWKAGNRSAVAAALSADIPEVLNDGESLNKVSGTNTP